MTAAGSEAGQNETMADAGAAPARQIRVRGGCVDGKPLGTLPNFATVDSNKEV